LPAFLLLNKADQDLEALDTLINQCSFLIFLFIQYHLYKRFVVVKGTKQGVVATPVIPALGMRRIRQEDFEFEASLGHISRPYLTTHLPLKKYICKKYN
jgi:hypothetical protein